MSKMGALAAEAEQLTPTHRTFIRRFLSEKQVLLAIEYVTEALGVSYPEAAIIVESFEENKPMTNVIGVYQHEISGRYVLAAVIPSHRIEGMQEAMVRAVKRTLAEAELSAATLTVESSMELEHVVTQKDIDASL